MPDIRVSQKVETPSEAVSMDWLTLPTGLIDERQALASAVVVALGTDRLATIDDDLPDIDSTDRRGWWGDLEAADIWGGWPIGSRLWLLERAKITGANARQGSTLARAESYVREALQPLIDKRVASRIDVSAVKLGIDRISVSVVVFRGPRSAIDLRYDYLWTEIDQPPQVVLPSEVSGGVALGIGVATGAGSAVGVGASLSPSGESLDFSEPNNSQYIPLLLEDS